MIDVNTATQIREDIWEEKRIEQTHNVHRLSRKQVVPVMIVKAPESTDIGKSKQTVEFMGSYESIRKIRGVIGNVLVGANFITDNLQTHIDNIQSDVIDYLIRTQDYDCSKSDLTLEQFVIYITKCITRNYIKNHAKMSKKLLSLYDCHVENDETDHIMIGNMHEYMRELDSIVYLANIQADIYTLIYLRIACCEYTFARQDRIYSLLGLSKKEVDKAFEQIAKLHIIKDLQEIIINYTEEFKQYLKTKIYGLKSIDNIIQNV